MRLCAQGRWEKAAPGQRSGRMIFPEDFDGVIPVDIATNEQLRYYGCSLADQNQVRRPTHQSRLTCSLEVHACVKEILARSRCLTRALSLQVQVALLYRHAVQDFTYQNSYLEDYVTNPTQLGGAGRKRLSTCRAERLRSHFQLKSELVLFC